MGLAACFWMVLDGSSEPNPPGMVRSALSQRCRDDDSQFMAPDEDRVIYLDLANESGMLCEDYAERNPDGTRTLLAALNLQPGGRPADEPVGCVFDIGIYRATGSRRLASIFGTVL